MGSSKGAFKGVKTKIELPRNTFEVAIIDVSSTNARETSGDARLMHAYHDIVRTLKSQDTP